MTVRPLSSLPPTAFRMAETTRKANVAVVTKSTERLAGVVNGNGIRYHLRGRGGNRVPLTAMWNVRAAGTDPVGAVKGIPEGFWHIVEYGRGGGYLVASRASRTGNARRGGQNTLIRSFGNDQLGSLKPIRTPYGPRQWARPGPHGSIGKPWSTSMVAGRPLVAQTQATQQFIALARVWS